MKMVEAENKEKERCRLIALVYYLLWKFVWISSIWVYWWECGNKIEMKDNDKYEKVVGFEFAMAWLKKWQNMQITQTPNR